MGVWLIRETDNELFFSQGVIMSMRLKVFLVAVFLVPWMLSLTVTGFYLYGEVWAKAGIWGAYCVFWLAYMVVRFSRDSTRRFARISFRISLIVCMIQLFLVALYLQKDLSLLACGLAVLCLANAAFWMIQMWVISRAFRKEWLPD